MDPKFLDAIEQKVTAGDSLTQEDLKKFKTVQAARNYQRGDNKAIDKVSWSIGLHRVEVDQTYYLVEIESLLPPGTKTLEEARAQVVSDYQDSMEKRWLEQLRAKYTVKVNNKSKKLVIRELISK
jgi:peptidyl-prolyl cis-trans isomerase SurA